MIAVFGGTGLVGNYLLLELLQRGNDVKVMVRSKSSKRTIKYVLELYLGKAEEYFNKIEWVEGNTLDYGSVFQTIEGVDYVYNCAAMVSFDSKEQADILKTNIEGTSNIVNACLEIGVKQLSHVSSIAALGDADNGELITEGSSWNPHRKHSIYSESKYKSELEVWRGIEEGLNAVIVNPSVILGFNNTNSGSQSFFSTISKGLKYYPPGSTGFVDVKDVVKCMVLLCEGNYSANRYTVNAENISYKDFFTLIARSLNKEVPKKKLSRFTSNFAIKLEKLRCGLTGESPKITKSSVSASFSKQAYSNEKIVKVLNYKFKSIEEAIKCICKYY